MQIPLGQYSNGCSRWSWRSNLGGIDHRVLAQHESFGRQRVVGRGQDLNTEAWGVVEEYALANPLDLALEPVFTQLKCFMASNRHYPCHWGGFSDFL